MFLFTKEQLSSYLLSNLNDDDKAQESSQPYKNGKVLSENNAENDKNDKAKDENKELAYELNDTFKLNSETTSSLPEDTNEKKTELCSTETDDNNNNNFSQEKAEIKSNKKLMKKMRPVLESHESFMTDNLSHISEKPQQNQINFMENQIVSSSSMSNANIYYELKIKLIGGKSLAIRDISGIFTF